MRAWLHLQEGPGAGVWYPLDPASLRLVSVGRSSECQIVLKDIRASRHHADIRWDGQKQAWFVVDNHSTNHTYVNGLEVHGPYDLRLDDRITVGDTTMVLRDASVHQPPTAAAAGPSAIRRSQTVRQRERTAEMQHLPPPAAAPKPKSPSRASRPASQPRPAVPSASERPSAGRKVAFWFVQGIVAAAIVLMASGSFLPWVRISGTVSQELEPLIQLGVGLLNQILGTGSSQLFDIPIIGTDVYGKLTLAIAAVSLLFLIIDMFFHQKWAVPGIVYLLAGLLSIVAVILDAQTFIRLGDQIRMVNLLFDIPVGSLLDGVNYFVDIKATFAIGLWLTLFGLVLLITGGIGRLAFYVMERSRDRSRH